MSTSGADLVFRSPAATDGALVFGITEAQETNVNLTIAAAFPAFSGYVGIETPSVELTITGALPALTGAVAAKFDLDIPTWFGPHVDLAWRDGAPLDATRVAGAWRDAEWAPGGSVSTPWIECVQVSTESILPWASTTLLPADPVAAPWRDGIPTNGDPVAAPWRDGIPTNGDPIALPWHDGIPTNADPVAAPWRDGIPTNADPVAVPWQDGAALQVRTRVAWRDGALMQVRTRVPWQDGTRLTSFGGSQTVPEPEHDVCYIPDAALVFKQTRALNGALLFLCDLHPDIALNALVVVPIKKVYLVINSVNLIRVDGGHIFPTLALNLSIDADSWTWGFSATVPGSELEFVEPDSDGTPVELQATINGNVYRLIAESLATDRSFGRKDLRISGRGKNAILDAPYAPVISRGNASLMTSQQLMDDALTLNGVSIGWDLEYGAGVDPWDVPAGVWAHQGTFISAVNTIAAASGAYVQPHRTADTLRILARYPSLPWNWATDVTPDYELPAAVTQREAITWNEYPRYNRVFVSGQSQGVIGQVTITGTAGDVLAPMVTDALITQGVAARQRGGSILGKTGRIADVSLRLPVLAETGVIEPGKFVRYVDGGTTRLGIVRSTSVDVKFPQVYQQIGVEVNESF